MGVAVWRAAIARAAAIVTRTTMVAGTTVIARAAIETRAAIVAAVAPVAGTAIIGVIPGTCANKHATNEPTRTVVAIRSAGVRVVTVIAIGTDGRRAISIGRTVAIAGSDTHANTNAHANLCLGGRCGRESEDCKQCKIF